MDGYTRYAIYYAPPEDHPLTAFGAAWLGWDPEAGRTVPHLEINGLPRPAAQMTLAPRKYGFHGTLKPPFRLAEGTTVTDLHAATHALTARLSPVRLDGMRLARIGQFVALVPCSESRELAQLAATLVESLDGYRAPLSPEDLARRRASDLSLQQEALLHSWGYPYVMDEFRFHITLSGSLPEPAADKLVAALEPHVTPLLEAPMALREVCLFGEGQDGRFHNLHRYPLAS